MLLTVEQIEVELAGLKNWTCDGKMLSKTFSFQHFDQSVAFFFFSQALPMKSIIIPISLTPISDVKSS
jgi:hypothetical protein